MSRELRWQGGNFASDLYWTSSEASSLSGYTWSFFNGNGLLVNNKNSNYRVRPIRRF